MDPQLDPLGLELAEDTMRDHHRDGDVFFAPATRAVIVAYLKIANNPGRRGASTDVCAGCSHTRRWHGVHGCDDCSCSAFAEASDAPPFDSYELETIATVLTNAITTDDQRRVRTPALSRLSGDLLSPAERKLYGELADRARREAARVAA